MRKIRYEFLLIAGLIMTLGCATVFADGKDSKVKRPKNSGILSIKTSEVSYPVKINGRYVGMSGVHEPAVFYLTPDVYTVEVEGPDGAVWIDRDVEIRKNRNYCICLKTITRTDYKPCPYDVHREGPARVKEGEEVIIRAVNKIADSPALTYNWKISAGRITSGMGTSSITIDTTGIGEGAIDVDVDVNDGVYPQCQQGMSMTTEVEKIIIREPEAFICDQFPSKSADDDKARFDNCAIQVQNIPDAQYYIIIYPQGGKNATATYNRLSKRTLQYVVNVRGIDPRRVQVVRGPDIPDRTRYVLWIIPPGARTPVP